MSVAVLALCVWLYEKYQHTVPPSLVNTVLSDTLPHLGDFELDQFAVGIAVTVVLDQEFVGLFVFTVGEQESR